MSATTFAATETMTAVVVHGAGDIRVAQLPVPHPGPGQVLVRIAYAGICGSDLHYYHEGKVGAFAVREPMVLGHEVVGWIEQDPGVPGPDGQPLPAGTPVTLHPATPGTPLPGLDDRPNIWPGSRYLGSAATLPHTQGAMSGFFVARVDQVRVLPAELDLRRAVLAEPLGVALHAIARGGGVAGRRVLVSGAGPVGLLAAGASVALGAAGVTVSDVLAQPLQRAAALGVHRTVEVPREQLPDQYFDVVLECSGAPSAVSGAVGATRPGGVVVQVGMLPADPRPVALAPLISREIDLRGSFRFDTELDQAVALLATAPQLGSVVTDVFDVTDVVAAFERASDPRASGKVVVRLNSTPPGASGISADASGEATPTEAGEQR